MALRGGSFTEMVDDLRGARPGACQASRPPLAARPAGGAARRRPGAGHEHRRPRGGPAGPRPGARDAGGAQRLRRADRRRSRGVRLEQRRRLGAARRRRARHQPRACPAGPDAAAPRPRRSRRTASTALLVIGGWTGLRRGPDAAPDAAEAHPALDIPIACLPATINNDLPGVDLSVGADTALNTIVEALDKIKQSAVASRRCFVVEVMGRYCGYLALMSGLAGGAERVYLHEEGVTLGDLQADLATMIDGFGRASGSACSSATSTPTRSTPPLHGRPLRGGRAAASTSATRSSATSRRAATRRPSIASWRPGWRRAGVDFLDEQARQGSADGAILGMRGGDVDLVDLKDLPRMVDATHQRPKHQWWLDLQPTERELSRADRAGRPPTP